MTIKSRFCPVRQDRVTVVTDLEDAVDRVICPDYNDRTGTCRRKHEAAEGGRLSQLLERLSYATLESHSLRCSIST